MEDEPRQWRHSRSSRTGIDSSGNGLGEFSDSNERKPAVHTLGGRLLDPLYLFAEFGEIAMKEGMGKGPLHPGALVPFELVHA